MASSSKGDSQKAQPPGDPVPPGGGSKVTKPRLLKPWRKGIPADWTSQEVQNQLKKLIQKHGTMSTFMTNDEKERGLNIMLIGPPGHGKSSMANALSAAVQNLGEVPNEASVKNEDKHVTKEFRRYRPSLPEGMDLKVGSSFDSANNNYNIAFSDFIGVDDGSSEEGEAYKLSLKGAVFGLLDNLHKAEYKNEVAEEELSRKEKEKLVEETTQEASAIIWVVDIQSSAANLGYMKELIAIADRQGIPQALAVTKVDLLDEECGDDPKNSYFSSDVEKRLRDTADIVGVPTYRTFPIKNFTDEMELEPSLSYQYLYMLYFILVDIEAKLKTLQKNDKSRRDLLVSEKEGSSSDVADDMAKLKSN